MVVFYCLPSDVGDVRMRSIISSGLRTITLHIVGIESRTLCIQEILTVFKSCLDYLLQILQDFPQPHMTNTSMLLKILPQITSFLQHLFLEPIFPKGLSSLEHESKKEVISQSLLMLDVGFPSIERG